MKEIFRLLRLLPFWVFVFFLTCGLEINLSPLSVYISHPIRGVVGVFIVIAINVVLKITCVILEIVLKQKEDEAYKRLAEAMGSRILKEKKKDVLEDEEEEAMINFSE